jgi:hypothetical protein
MTTCRTALLAVITALMMTCALSAASHAAGMAASDAAERRVLVMLRTAPPHFRPDSAFAPGYSSRVRSGGQRRIAETLARRYDLAVVESWPMPALRVDCFVMEAASRDDIVRALNGLARDERVESAQAMQVFHVLGHDDPLYPLQNAALHWQLAEVHRIATGRNVRVAEIDSGVEIEHPDLRGRVVLTRNFADSPARPEAHGTAVAGIIAARADNGTGIVGVAPEAALYALRACEEGARRREATCTSFTLAKALQFALERDVQVINLSVGGPRDRLLERLLDAAIARRIAVVSAVDSGSRDGGFPAAHPGVLAVAPEGSSDAPASALRAPGRDIPTTTTGQGWGFVTGASYAAANVSGVVALLLERVARLDTAELRRALVPDGSAGQHRVDACSAVARATGECVCGCSVAADIAPARER